MDFLDKERRLRRGQSILNVVGYLDVGEADTFFFFGLDEKFVCDIAYVGFICTLHTSKVIAIFKTSIKYFYNKYNIFRKNI